VKVALVHDWLTGMRGGEKVLDVLCELFPGADLFTLVHRRGSVSPLIEGRRITTSFVQRLPLAATRYRLYLPLFPFAIEQFSFDGYDLVVSSSHCAAKAVVVPGRTRHIAYCHSPMRYAWDQFEEYFGPARVGPRTSRWVYRPLLSRLARWDAATAPRVHRFVANSRHVAGRIQRYYNRASTVVHPPVDTNFFQPSPAVASAALSATLSAAPALVVSALVPYKRVDRAIEACALAGIPLRIAGDGPDRERLERQAGATQAGSAVTFLGRVSDEVLRDEYRAARVAILPGEEDFGIAPLEAQACGRPVVALARGGALETVKNGQTGLLFPEPTAASLAETLRVASTWRFDSGRIRTHAEAFSREEHAAQLRAVIDDTMTSPIEQRW
jgi:glycosyltransferase involved in cell wall biosynthesis